MVAVGVVLVGYVIIMFHAVVSVCSMDCLHPVRLSTGYVPCGKCVACLSLRRQQWVVRLKQELKDSIQCYFITLTYDPEHLPVDNKGHPVVCRRDVQLFLKRLRKRLSPVKLRYFLVSEYGTHTLRPHYHALIFFKDNCYDIEEFQKSVFDAWQSGHVKVDQVSDRRINYCAKYCVVGSVLPDYLHGKDTKPFLLSSRQPGIGAGYIKDSTVNFHCSTMQPFMIGFSGVKTIMPRYYRDKIFDDAMKAEINEQVSIIRQNKLKEYEEKYSSVDSNYHSNRTFYPISAQQKDQYERRVKDKLFKNSKL